MGKNIVGREQNKDKWKDPEKIQLILVANFPLKGKRGGGEKGHSLLGNNSDK